MGHRWKTETEKKEALRLFNEARQEGLNAALSSKRAGTTYGSIRQWQKQSGEEPEVQMKVTRLAPTTTPAKPRANKKDKVMLLIGSKADISEFIKENW